jgi:hypothetical protein
MRHQAFRLGTLLLLASFGCATFTRANRAPRVIGVVDEPRSDLVRIRTRNRDTREVRIDGKTRYTKWLTHQPWTVDKLADAKSLSAGRCVNILLRTDDRRVAQLVEVSWDRPGTPQDPCRGLR